MSIKVFIFIFFALYLSKSIAQSTCNCPSYSQSKDTLLKQLKQGKEKEAMQTISRMMTSEDRSCSSLAYLILVNNSANSYKFDSLPLWLNKVKGILDKLNCKDNEQLIQYNMFYGKYYYAKGNYGKSLEYALNYLKIVEDAKDTLTQIDCQLNISLLLARMKQPDKAIFYFQKAVNLNDFVAKPDVRAKNYLNIGSRYLWFYQDLKNEEYYKNAVDLIKRGMSISKNIGNLDLQKNSYNLMQSLAFEKGDFRLALNYVDSALTLCYESYDVHTLYSLNSDKADIYLNLKDYKLATLYADSGVYYAKINDDKAAMLNAWQFVYEIAKEAKNSDKALFALENVKQLNDSLINKEQLEIVNELEQKYNKAQNEKTINELNQQKTFSELRSKYLVAIIFAIVLLLIILVVLYRQTLVKNKLKTVEIEQRLNRARINPHFFFNVLGSIQTLSHKSQNPDKAFDLISKFSKIMRQSLESTYNDMVTIEDEIIS